MSRRCASLATERTLNTPSVFLVRLKDGFTWHIAPTPGTSKSCRPQIQSLYWKVAHVPQHVGYLWGLTSGSFTIHATICCARLCIRLPPRYHVFQIVSRGCDRHFQWLWMWSRSLTFPGNQNVWITSRKKSDCCVNYHTYIYNTSIDTHNIS